MATTQHLAGFFSQPADFEQHRTEIYTPLDADHNEIRLMTVHPGCFDARIQISIEKVSLNDDPVYEAVSYTWEDLNQTRILYLHDHEYVVTKNQFEAVRHFRHEDATRVLWMDVFCIDEANLAEKGDQVSKMGDIYAGATTTLIWLGQLTEDWIGTIDSEQMDQVTQLLNNDPDIPRMSEDKDRIAVSPHLSEFNDIVNGENGSVLAALYILRLLTHDHHLLHMPIYSVDDQGKACPNPDWHKAVETLRLILGRPWWQRAWVLQEVAWSKKPPMVHMGSFEFPLEVFCGAATGLFKHVMMPGACCWAKLQMWCLRDLRTDNQSLVTRAAFLYNFTSVREMATTRKASFEQAVSMSAGLKVTDPRDCIYSLLSLAPQDERVYVDYNYTIAEVFTLASWTSIKSANSLMQLEKGGSKRGSNNWHLPSWVRDWSKLPNYMPYRHWMHSWMHNTKTYSAPPNWDRTKLDTNDGSLTIPHVTLDTVEACFLVDVPQTQAFHVLTTIWLRQLGESGYAFELPALIRTIFRNTCINTQSPFEPADIDYLITLYEQLSQPERYPDPKPTGFTGYDLHMAFRNSTRFSRLFVTEQRRLGIGHEGIEPGDVLCHVQGCCLPLAVRKIESSGPSGRGSLTEDVDRFELIDACYVDDIVEIENTGVDWDKAKDLKLV